jgi:hypothetical protein
MQAIHHFIIEVKDPFKDKIEIGKLELFVDKKISRDRSSNRFGKIISCPIIADSCELKEGFEIIFDATVLYRQVYKEGVQESIHLMDKANSLYKIEPDMIVLFRENKESEWKGYKDNLMVEFITEDNLNNVISWENTSADSYDSDKKSSLISDEVGQFPRTEKIPIITSIDKKTVIKGKAKVKYRNEELENQEIENGQVVFIRPDAGIPFFFKNETLYWIRTKDVLAV